MTGADFQAVRDAAADSVIGRAAIWTDRRLRAAFTESWFRRQLQHRSTQFFSCAAEDRVRYIAATIAIAGMVNVALLSLVGSYPAPGIPKALVAVAAAGAAVVACAPRSFVAAWPASTLARAATKAARLFQNSAE